MVIDLRGEAAVHPEAEAEAVADQAAGDLPHRFDKLAVDGVRGAE